MAGKGNGDRGGEGRQVIARLADELLPVLIARLEASGLGELEVREEDWRVRLRRPALGNGAVAAATRAHQSPSAAASPPETRQSAARPDRERELVTSPAVGYFTPRDDLQVGAALGAGDVIGHIDVLGVRQEVVAGDGGTLARLDVETGQAVEYGQPIARIEPEAHG